ncbi:MAG: hypothetical protein RSP_18740 [Rhodanobacter sp.]
MSKVNLDALIVREDFEASDVRDYGKKKDTASIEDMKSDSFFFSNLRKPDFQRETNEWDSQKIASLVKSFIDGDLIPSIILWRNSAGYLFVIDGSHRLSALAAWINNDYGDGEQSKKFYDGLIPEEQISAANEARRLVEKNVGSYSDCKLALTHPDKVRPEIVQYAKNLGALSVQLQWVEGDAAKAENSFFKINQQAAPIDKTELRLLKERTKPFSIAARAIIRSGKGHKYWSRFTNTVQAEIQSNAKDINAILFAPSLKTPIRTLELPLAGKLYSAATLPLIVDMIGIVSSNQNKDDESGEETILVLKEVKTAAQKINSSHPGSLGLHPAIYFYSQEGRHKNSSFLAITDFVKRLETKAHKDRFIRVRPAFESFLVNYDYVLQQINRKYRIAQASYPHISKLLSLMIEKLDQGKDIPEAVAETQTNPEFGFLTLNNQEIRSENTGRKFNRDDKSSIFLKDVLEKSSKCPICGGALHMNSISFDHKTPRRDGGSDSSDNGQTTHPYCNTGYKS